MSNEEMEATKESISQMKKLWESIERRTHEVKSNRSNSLNVGEVTLSVELGVEERDVPNAVGLSLSSFEQQDLLSPQYLSPSDNISLSGSQESKAVQSSFISLEHHSKSNSILWLNPRHEALM